MMDSPTDTRMRPGGRKGGGAVGWAQWREGAGAEATDAPPWRSLIRCRCTGGASVNSAQRIKIVSPKMAAMKSAIATVGDVLGTVAMPIMREE